MTIRAARPDDALPLTRAQVSGWKDTYRGPVRGAFLDQLTADQWAPTHRRRIDDRESSHTYLVAELHGSVRGFVSFGPARLPEPSTSGEIYALYVAPVVIGQGLGAALLHEAAGALRGRGYAVVMLWVMDGNERAVRFYERQGMQHRGARKHDVVEGVGEWDDLRYAFP